MFGIICAGRPVQTDVQQVAPDKYVFNVQNGSKVNHLVLFLLPGASLPAGMAASVYFQLPGQEFQLLGGLSDQKPSAIFKINGPATSSIVIGGMAADDDNVMMDDSTGPGAGSAGAEFEITIGISIEPIETVEKAVLASKEASTAAPATSTALVSVGRPSAPSNANDIAALANKIVQQAYNFLGGFTGPDGKVPMKAFDEWWNKFKVKINANPRFLDNLD